MDCYECQDYISAYIEKELSLSKINEFDNHISGCSVCEDIYNSVVEIIGSLKNARKFVVSKNFNTELQARLKQLSEQPVRRFSRYFEGRRIFGFEPKYAFASVAVAIAIVVLTLSLFPDTSNPSFSPLNPSTASQEFIRPMDTLRSMYPGEELKTTLASESDKDSMTSQDKISHPKLDFQDKIQLVKDPGK